MPSEPADGEARPSPRAVLSDLGDLRLDLAAHAVVQAQKRALMRSMFGVSGGGFAGAADGGRVLRTCSQRIRTAASHSWV